MFPKAIKFRFPNTNIDCFLTVINSSELKRWKKNKQLCIEYLEIISKGRKKKIRKYQRTKESRRVAKIKEFLKQTSPRSVLLPILPQNVVLNVRRRFKPKKSGQLYVLPRNLRFHVIDGQHRIEALLELQDEDMLLPVTITVGLNEIQEAALFLLINHTQKKVPAAIRLLDIAGMRKSGQGRKYDLHPLLKAIGFRDIDVEALDIAAEQVLEDHFWSNKIKLPASEEE